MRRNNESGVIDAVAIEKGRDDRYDNAANGADHRRLPKRGMKRVGGNGNHAAHGAAKDSHKTRAPVDRLCQKERRNNAPGGGKHGVHRNGGDGYHRLNGGKGAFHARQNDEPASQRQSDAYGC